MVISNTTALDQSLVITNQSSNSALFASVQEDSNGIQSAYAQPLTALPDNAKPTVIPEAGGTATLTLNQPNQQAYNLIGMRPDNLFPVINQIAVVPLDCSQQPSSKCVDGATSYYPDITVSQADVNAMQQAFQFHQNVLAYPDSDLVKNFFKVLTTYKTDPLNVETAVNQFFQQTKDYSQCTLENYIAASTYGRNYAFAWANLQNSFTYLVFQPATDPKATVGLVNIGKIVLTKQPNAPFPADVSDCNGGFTITYHPAQGSDQKLSLVNGRLVSIDSASAPSISLILTYGLKSTFSQVATDTTAWPVLIGKIDGVQVIAVGDIPPSPSANLTSTSGKLTSNWHDDWVKLFRPKTAVDWVKVVGIVAAMAIGLGITAFMVYKTVQWIRIGRALGKLPTPEEIAAKLQEIDASLAKYLPSEETIAKETGLDGTLAVYTPEYEQECQNAVIARSENLFELQQQAFAISMNEYRNSIETLTKYGVRQDIRTATSDLVAASELLSKANTPELLKNSREDIKAALDGVKTSVKAAVEAVSKSLSREIKLELENWEITAETSVKMADSYQEEADLVEDGSSPLIDE